MHIVTKHSFDYPISNEDSLPVEYIVQDFNDSLDDVDDLKGNHLDTLMLKNLGTDYKRSFIYKSLDSIQEMLYSEEDAISLGDFNLLDENDPDMVAFNEYKSPKC